MTEDKKKTGVTAESGEQSKKKCFIIMPITTPEELVTRYKGDSRHFDHVLDCLFMPAIVKSGLDPIKPIASGADLIHGRTIKLIEQSDLTLCDISTFNPNVFFELGIRTALNKPVCLVRDQFTEKIPFDTSAVNHHTYNGSLSAWETDGEIDKLATHISASLSTSQKGNELWTAFSIATAATPLNEKVGSSDQLAYFSRIAETLVAEMRRLPDRLSKRRTIDEMIAANLGRRTSRYSNSQDEEIDKDARLRLDIIDREFIALKRMIQITAASAGINIHVIKDDLSRKILVDAFGNNVIPPIAELLSAYGDKHHYEILYSNPAAA